MAAGTLVQGRRLPHLTGVPRVLAAATLATAALLAAHLAPGMLGVLSRWTAAAAALALLGAAARVPRLSAVTGREAGPGSSRSGRGAGGGAVPADGGAVPARAPGDRAARDATEPVSEGPLSWLLAGGAAGALALWLVASAWNRTVLPPEGIDTLTFHLPNVGEWIRSGTVWRVDQFSPLLTNGNYPQNGDLAFLAVVLPWRSDWLAGAVNPVFVALAAAAVYALAVEIGATRPAAILGGSLFAALPVVGLAANGEAMTDSLMLAALGAGALFLLRHERGAPRSELWLAGLALGLAFGTKWYAVWAVAAIAAVWAGARGRGRASLLRDGAALAGLVALAGGFWLLRNLVESGNPVFPIEVGALGATIFDAPRDVIRECSGWTIAHYLGDGGVWSARILPAYRETYALPGAAIGLGLVGAAALAVRGGARSPRGAARGGRGAVVAGLAATGLLAAGYALTPYSAFGPEGDPILVGANARYLMPALLVAAPLAAWALSRAGPLRLPLELAAAAAVAEGIDRAFEVPLHVVAAVLAALAALAGAAWTVERLAARAPRRAIVRAVAATALLAAVAAAGHARQREFHEGRYESGDAAIAWIARNAPGGHRVGLAGSWSVNGRSPVWPAFGERVGNEVDYVGPTVRHLLREHRSRAGWAADVRRRRIDLLLVGRGGYSRECPVPGQLSDDDRWAREEGFPVLARSDRLTLYRVRPRRLTGRRGADGRPDRRRAPPAPLRWPGWGTPASRPWRP
ncbi:MAG TPA: phospholipid carrier-dependent glycosyltransferase [Thermoleophilaceae bacterium]